MSTSNPFIDISNAFAQNEKARLTVALTWQPTGKGLQIKQRLQNLFRYTTAKTFVVYGYLVGNVYRVSGISSVIPKTDKEDALVTVAADYITKYMDIVRYAVATAIQNNHLEPDQELLDIIKNNFNSDDLFNVLKHQSSFDIINSINEFYGIFDDKSNTTKKYYKSITEKRESAVPHRVVGEALRYFKGGMSECDIKWTLTWENLLLYMASIPDLEDRPDSAIETKDANDIF